MKSFSQFLQESYLNEEEARQGSLMTRSGKPQDFRNPKKIPFTATDPTPTSASRRLPAGAPEGAKTSPGQLEIPEPKTTKVPGSQTTKALPPSTRGGPLAKTTVNPQDIPKVMMQGAADAARDIAASKTNRTIKALKAGKNIPTVAKTGGPNVFKTVKAAAPGKFAGVKNLIGKAAGPAAFALDAGLEAMDQKARGRKTGSALTMGATKAAGGLAAAKAGALTGAKFGSFLGPKGAAVGAAFGGLTGYLAGSGIAGKASEVIAGATGKEKAAMATANRQKQAGSAVKGIGGKTTFSQTKPGGPAFMSTGSGSQRKTVQLAKTGVVQRGGQSVAGNLAFKDGKAVYKAGPSAQSLAKTSSNPLERIGRSLFAGAYKKSDAANAAKKLAAARANDAARNKKLSVKFKPGG